MPQRLLWMLISLIGGFVVTVCVAWWVSYTLDDREHSARLAYYGQSLHALGVDSYAWTWGIDVPGADGIDFGLVGIGADEFGRGDSNVDIRLSVQLHIREQARRRCLRRWNDQDGHHHRLCPQREPDRGLRHRDGRHRHAWESLEYLDRTRSPLYNSLVKHQAA